MAIACSHQGANFCATRSQYEATGDTVRLPEAVATALGLEPGMPVTYTPQVRSQDRTGQTSTDQESVAT